MTDLEQISRRLDATVDLDQEWRDTVWMLIGEVARLRHALEARLAFDKTVP